MSIQIGLVGARGHVGSELIRLVAGHPEFELNFVASREREGRALSEYEPVADSMLTYINPTADEAATRGVDALVLALPNGKAHAFVAAVDAQAPRTVVLDLSADFRFDSRWHYGLPELTRSAAHGQRRIANPGCYATAMQLAIAPMRDVLSDAVQCFGVSGFSGAGTMPSDRNDAQKLHDNLMPYSLAGHVHEREVMAQLGHAIEFMPAVAGWFRGLVVTANLHLDRAFSLGEVSTRYRQHYFDEALVRVLEDAPWVSRIAGEHHAEIGGFTLADDGDRLVVVATLDNLLKGAATQALQNLNLAFGLPELTGLPQ